MNDSKIEISGNYLIKTLLIVGGIWVLCFYGASLIMPLLIAAIIATLLDKVVKKMKKWGLPKWAAITISVMLLIIFFFLLTWLLTSQISTMANDWPTIKDKGTEKLNNLTQWANENLNLNYKNYIENNQKIIEQAKSLATLFLSSLTTLLSQSFIIFIYIILFLMQKKRFINFFKKLVSNKDEMDLLLKKAAKTTNDYFMGKSKIMVFLFVIYYIGFLLGEVPYALFLALFAALFSIIPYLGNLIGGGVAIILSYLYAGTTPALIVIGVVSAAQLVENYLLTPWIIGDSINLNPFITIFGIIVFSALWGIVGAIISLPLIGVLKVVFDHTKEMEAYTYFLKKEEN